MLGLSNERYTRMNDSFTDLVELENYEVHEEVGKGQYGCVRRVFDRLRQCEFAMKIVESDRNTGVPPSILKEVGILREVDHPNIVRLQDVIFCQTKICILYELAQSDLHKQIYTQPRLPLPKIKTLAYQLFLGLAELHRQKIIHRDLKPANVLFFQEAETVSVKIADFGISRVSSVPVKAYTNDVVTLWYRAPELLLGSNTYNELIDIWSVGCIIAELITRKPLFPGKDADDQMRKVLELISFRSQGDDMPILRNLPLFQKFKAIGDEVEAKELEFPDEDEKECLGLLKDCLMLDPSKRPSALQALENPWFQSEKSEENCLNLLF